MFGRRPSVMSDLSSHKMGPALWALISWKLLLLFLSTVCISVVLVSRFELAQLKYKVSVLESNFEQIFRELKTKDESIENLKNILLEKCANAVSTQNNLQGDNAAEYKHEGAAVSAVWMAENVVTDMLEKGLALSKDALKRAKAFNEQKIGFSEKMTMGTNIVNEKVKEMDQRFQVSEKAKSVIESAGETIGSISSVIKKNDYVSTGALWVTGAFDRVVAKSAEYYLGHKSKENNVREEGND